MGRSLARERANKRKELARLLVEAALRRCHDLGVHITLRVGNTHAAVVSTALGYRHPEGD